MGNLYAFRWYGVVCALAMAALLLVACMPPCESNGPSIWITDMSPWGSENGYVAGRICNVAPAQCWVVGYVYIPESAWWVKPYEARPLTTVDSLGGWSIDTTTGGVDYTATGLTVFLIPREYDPPRLLGAATLPDELYTQSLAHVELHRDRPPDGADRTGPNDDGDGLISLTVNNGTGTGQYPPDAVVEIAAQVPADHRFDRWEGNTEPVADVYGASTTVTLSQDMVVTATFYPWPTPAYRLTGLNFGPFVGANESPEAGTVIDPGRMRDLIARVGPYTEWLRTYGSSLGLEHVGRLGQAFDLKVVVGVYIGPDPEANRREIDAAVAIGTAGHADMILVGTEALLRNDVSAETLIDYIGQVKAQVSGIPVATADAHGELLAHPDVVAACDVVCANFYPYWEGLSVDGAVRSLHQQYQALESVYPDKQIIVAETGWPSDGEQVGQAVPSVENAASYFLNFVSWARANDVEYFYFEAYDEPWKVANEGPPGAHWGCWTSEGTLKEGFQPVFDGQTLEDNWSSVQTACAPDDPMLQLTYVPPIGSDDFLEGQVCHVAASEHRVAVAIRVGSGWWTKPYWNARLTAIDEGGTWRCDIVTGGNDRQATAVAAFLVPVGYDPPLLSGGGTLPDKFFDNAVAHVQVERNPAP